jgi:hypothetical protein
MSFDLPPTHDDPIEQAMSDLASIIRQAAPRSYESDGDGLFAALVRGLRVYVTAWARSGDVSGSLAGVVLDADDLADPRRADDPHATFFSLMDLTLESLRDNIEYELSGDGAA